MKPGEFDPTIHATPQDTYVRSLRRCVDAGIPFERAEAIAADVVRMVHCKAGTPARSR